MSALISAGELEKILKLPDVKVLDASYNLPPSVMGIPGALDFDIDDVADPAAPLAHTVPSAEIFSAKVGALGISNSDLVIVYDRSGLAMAAARGWWMFRLFGHGNVRVLDGGLPAWVHAGFSIGEKAATSTPVSFKVSFRGELLKTADQLIENLDAKNFTVLDARDAARFRGDMPDPRPHVQTGHIPGSRNIPFMQLLNRDGTLKIRQELEKEFQSLSLQNKFACSCGSGVTACVVALALHELGHKDAAIYDGSWAEWGSNAALPKAKGI